MTPPFPIIRTERLLLRQIVESDINQVFLGLSNPEVTRFYAVHFDTLDATKEQMTWYANLEKNGTQPEADEAGIWWAMESSSGEFIGACGLNDVNKDLKKAEIGCWLLPEYWGQGYMVEALPEVCKFAFQVLKLHRIEGFVESDNVNCKKAMAKLDFQHESTLRDCELKNGKYISLDVYVKEGDF